MRNDSKNDPNVKSDVGVVITRPVTKPQTVIDLYLTESVESSGKYLEIISVLNGAEEGDQINVYLANYGGSCHSCVMLANFLRTSKAHIRTIVTAPCYSAGTTLALCGDSLVMGQNTFLMFHNYSSVSIGKGGELQMNVDETRRWIHKYMKDIHAPFLTKKEIKQIEEDKDVYVHFDDPDLPNRIKRHFPNGESRIYGVGDGSK